MVGSRLSTPSRLRLQLQRAAAKLDNWNRVDCRNRGFAATRARPKTGLGIILLLAPFGARETAWRFAGMHSEIDQRGGTNLGARRRIARVYIVVKLIII